MLPLVFAWLAGATFVASLAFFLYSYLVTFRVLVATSDGIVVPVAIDLALFSAFALHHSVFARTPIKRAISTVTGPSLERAFYTFVASILFVLVCVYWQPVPGVLYHLEGGWRFVAYSLLLLGLLVTAVGARALDVLELAGIRQVLNARAGSGAARPGGLKTDGLYGFVRHPVYFGWVLIVLGVSTMTATQFVFAVISTLYLAVAIPFEERSLIETFGASYASYQQNVRWRMLPGIY